MTTLGGVTIVHEQSKSIVTKVDCGRCMGAAEEPLLGDGNLCQCLSGKVLVHGESGVPCRNCKGKDSPSLNCKHCNGYGLENMLSHKEEAEFLQRKRESGKKTATCKCGNKYDPTQIDDDPWYSRRGANDPKQLATMCRDCEQEGDMVNDPGRFL